jgi:rhodanese-related sulfurtransferase
MRIALLTILLATLACEAPPAGVSEISPDELLANPPESALILDVRSEAEFTRGHVPGAVNLSHDRLAAQLDELDAAKDQPIVVYCESGRRASLAADVLLEAGFTDIRHLTGDMSDWRSKERPTE